MYSEWHKKSQLMLDMVCRDIQRGNHNVGYHSKPLYHQNPIGSGSEPHSGRLDISDKTYVLPADYYATLSGAKKDSIRTLYATDEFIANYNPFIRHIVRRTRDFLENTINPASGETYLKKNSCRTIRRGRR